MNKELNETEGRKSRIGLLKDERNATQRMFETEQMPVPKSKLTEAKQ